MLETKDSTRDLRRMVSAGLHSCRDFERAFRAVGGYWRWFRKPPSEIVERLINAAHEIERIREPLKSAIVPYENVLRDGSAVGSLYGVRGPNRTECVVRCMDARSQMAEVEHSGITDIGRFRTFFWGWRLARYGSKDVDLAEFESCLDIEFARLNKNLLMNGQSAEVRTHKLSERETEIIGLVREHGPMRGKNIAKAIHVEFSGSFREGLSRLVSRSYLKTTGKGYVAT